MLQTHIISAKESSTSQAIASSNLAAGSVREENKGLLPVQELYGFMRIYEDVVIYRLWRSQSNPYFGPSDPGATQLLETSTFSSAITYSDTTALLDSTQAFYQVEGTSVSGAATRTANAGVFSFALVPGSE